MNAFPPSSLPWWRSKIIVGALVSIIMKLLVVSGLTGEFTAEEGQQIADAALLLVSAIGDLVVIGSRVRQRYAPKVVASQPSGTLPMMALACLLIAPLMGCMPSHPSGLPSSPGALADRTRIDEQAALTPTLAYTAAARAAALAIEFGLVRDPATINRIGDLDHKAFAAILAIEAAYRSGNADSYAAALQHANKAVDELVQAVGAKP